MKSDTAQHRMDFIVSVLLGEDHDCRMTTKGFCEVCEEKELLEAEKFLRENTTEDTYDPDDSSRSDYIKGQLDQLNNPSEGY